MPLSPLRGSPLLPIGTDDPNERAARLTELANANRTALGAGAASGAEGITAGNIANQALDAELQGDPRASALRQLALDQGQRAAADTAGRITSYQDVHGISDALDYAALQAGQAGVTTLPPLAAALVTRGAGRLAAPGAFLGSTIPAYQMEKGEAVLNQYQDPTTANADPHLRERAAQGKGLVNAALESIVPASLASGFGHAGHSALRTIGTSMLEEGLTEGLQQGVGNVAQEAVKQGGLNHAALMAPFDPANRQGQIDAALAGAFGGGGVSLPTSVSQVVANGLVAAKDHVVEKAQQAAAKTGEAAQDLGTKLKDFSDEQLAAHLGKDEGPVPLAPHTPAEDVLQRSTDPEEIMRAQDAHEAGQEQHAAQVAQNIAGDEHAPADLKARAADFLAGKTPRELVGDLVDQARQVDVARHSARVRETATKAIDTAKTAVKGFLDTPLPGTKQSEEETKPVDFAPMVQKLFDGLAPEFKTDADVRARLKPLAEVLHSIGADEAPTRRGYALLQDLHDKGVFNLFEDPSKALDFGLQPALEAVTRARTEAGRPDSFFTTALTPAFQANPNTRTAIAKIVDRAAINNGRVSPDERTTLERAFGSTKAAGTMLRHYASLMPKLTGPITVAAPEQLAEEQVAEKDPSLTEIAPKDTKVQHHFATQDEQPYLALKSEQGAVTKFARDGKVSPARQAAQLLRDKDPSRNVRVQNLLDHARETGKDPAVLAAKLRSDFAEREAAGKARPGEDLIHEAAGADDEALLRSHEVLRSTQRDNARDLMFDSDPELHAKARVLVDQVRNAKTPEAAAAMRSTHFKVWRKVVNGAGEQVERPTTYSAESLWKYFGDKQQAKNKTEGGATTSEGEGQRAQNLFSQAIAEIAQDRNVTKIELPEHLVLDRKNSVTLQKDLRMPTEAIKHQPKIRPTPKSDNPRWLDTVAEAEREINEKGANGESTKDRIQAQLNTDDPRGTLEKLQRMLETSQQKRSELPKNPAGFHELAKRLKAEALIRQGMFELLDEAALQPSFEKDVTREGAREDRHETNLARLDEQEHYVGQLEELTHGIPLFAQKLADAHESLEDLKTAVHRGARQFEETTGEPLVPGDKEAAHNAKQSAEDATGDPLQVDAALKASIKAEMTRILGKGAKLSFSKNLQGSGDYNPATRQIRLALAAVNPMATAYHEALHDFFNTLSGSEQGRQLRAGLMTAASTENVRKQLGEFFKDSPGALSQIESDGEERAAYAFQLWAMGKHIGKPLITLGPAGHNVFTKIATFIRQLVGVVSQDERALDVFNALYDGEFAEPSEVGALLEKKGLFTLGDKLRAVSGPLADISDKLMMVSTDRLRQLGNSHTDWLAGQFMNEPGTEKGGLAFLPRRARVVGKYKNEIATLFQGTTLAQRREAIRNLQSLKPPSSPLETGLRTLLDELHTYQVQAGVKQYNEKTGQWDQALPKLQHYFPRVWDTNKILNNKTAFMELLQANNVSIGQAAMIVKTITHGDGHIPLDHSEYQVGYTPFAAGVENRALTFIDQSNAAAFAHFQSDDLAHVMTTYVNQAVHRGEFARQFGNDGKVIDNAINAAGEKLDDKQLLEARTTVKALVGTLGADINPRGRQLMSAAIAAENMILLPLTMFSQVIDAVGVGLRANDTKEAWTAMGRGFKEIGRAIAKSGDDYDTFMAKSLGIIEDASVGDAMGDTYASQGLSGFVKRWNREFFKWNGMEAWNRGMRTAAMTAGERFIIRNAKNDRYMRELNLSESDIMPMKNGRLALTADQMQQTDPKLDPGEAAARELRVQEALFRFVDGAVLRPNAANRPVWASDPHWMLMFHLKQFSFTFQKTILARVSNEMDHGNVLPAVLLATYVPVIMASSALKAVLTGTTIGDGSMLAALSNGITRSGVLGPRSFGTDALADLGRGQMPGTSFLGPALQHAWMAARWAVGDSQVTSSDLIKRSIPLGRYF